MTTKSIDLILIRHGETSWNVERRLQGHLDIALNDNGMAQAQALADALGKEQLDAIICSDLQRALQTAQTIAQHNNLPCLVQPAWRERNFGGFEGELISTLSNRFPVEYANWRIHNVDSVFPPNAKGECTGESIRQFHARIENALLSLVREFEGKKIAVITHGGILECAYRIAHQLPLNAPRQTTMLNASLNRFVLSAENSEPGSLTLRLVQWGDTTHLTSSLDELSS